MNLQNFTRAKTFNKLTVAALISLLCWPAFAGWEIDLSRRQDDLRQRELRSRQPAAVDRPGQGFVSSMLSSAEPLREVVVLNSKAGFVPNKLNLEKGRAYKIHVVNVNQELKNVSFVMDAFSQHHATYYGDIKSFQVEPKKEGVYSFVCPETSAQGKLVVYSPESSPPDSPPAVEMRRPAAEAK